MLKFVFVASVLCLCYLASVEAISGTTIADKAESYEGSTRWSKASGNFRFKNKDKCNLFINDVMKEVGGSVPQRRWWIYSPIGAMEWADAESSYLTDDDCWRNVESPEIGDVMAADGHVAFYTDHRTTTSASTYEVLNNDWGFRRGYEFGSASRPYVYWRYIC